MEQKLKRLNELDQKIASINYSMALVSWDGQTVAPKKSVAGRAKAMMTLSDIYFSTLINDETNELISELEQGISGLHEDGQARVKLFRKEYDAIAKIPKKEYVAFSEARALSSAGWESAKNNNDFSIFEPHLEKMINYTKRNVDYMEKDMKRYDVLLDMYETGLTMDSVDNFFGYLKSEIVPLVDAITKSGKNEQANKLNKTMYIKEQKMLVNGILDLIGFDLDRGLLGESEHPFTTNLDRNDVRFSVHYYEDDFRSGMLSAFHEGGHALYEQNIDEKFVNSIMGNGTTMGIHESQSRFYENHIALSETYLEVLFQQLINDYSVELGELSLVDFNFEMNKVTPSLIRVEADEVTYPLHIMIRYELEKLMFEQGVPIKDLPELWNQKYKEYLGIMPKDAKEGILQDVHWSEALFGYFPSYALGSAYSAQFYNTMSKTVDVNQAITSGDMSTVLQWLSTNIHCYGSTKNPAEIIKKATGEDFNPEYYVRYIKDKYRKLYQL